MADHGRVLAVADVTAYGIDGSESDYVTKEKLVRKLNELEF